MKKLARLLLLCLMIIAIPLQGIASTAVQSCDPEHHQSMTKHGGEHKAVEHTSDRKDHSTHSTDNAHSPEAKKCSCCSNCCTGAPMMATSPEPQACNPSSEKITPNSSLHEGHITDGPDRPPRAQSPQKCCCKK